MDGSSIDEDLHREVVAIAEDSGCELLHIRFKSHLLQIFLDRPDGGVTLDDCQTVSKQVSAFLDVHDFGTKKYVLEVSSPGLDRELFGPKDYERFCGDLVRVTFFGGPERKKQTIVGRLQAFDPAAAGGGRVTLSEESSEKEHVISLDDIKIARLEVEI